MKRSIEETDNANENDARQKLKDSLIPFDQSREASEALLLQCCYSILEKEVFLLLLFRIKNNMFMYFFFVKLNDRRSV